MYAGPVEFPVDALRLGDVPYLLPALQKQQGRLGFVSEATAFPCGHALCGTISTFMAAVGVLRHQMEDAQEEVTAEFHGNDLGVEGASARRARPRRWPTSPRRATRPEQAGFSRGRGRARRPAACRAP